MEDRETLSHLNGNCNKACEVFLFLAGDLTNLEKRKRNVVSRAQQEHVLNTADTGGLLLTWGMSLFVSLKF